MQIFLNLVCAWFVAAYIAHIVYFLGFFSGFFHSFITGDFWRGVFLAATLIYIFEAIFKYSLGMEGDEYVHTYLVKFWKVLCALYERLFNKAKAEQKQLAADLKKRFK